MSRSSVPGAVDLGGEFIELDGSVGGARPGILTSTGCDRFYEVVEGLFTRSA
ncbi:MAG TPA: hypothetical protein VFH23_03965 [Jiangellaceae bacterium]|nr:hypothetical protein [Jiangellaceae bacterium]